MGGKCPPRSSLLLAVTGLANENFPSGGTSEACPFASAPLIPCKLISSHGQASICPQRGPAGKEMPHMFLYPVWRSCNYMCCFSSISLKELLSFQESLERSWLHLLQGPKWHQNCNLLPLALCRKQTKAPASILGAGRSSSRRTPLRSTPGIPEDVRQESGNSPGRLHHPLIRQHSSQDNVARSSNESCNFRPWKKFLPNTLCSCQRSAPQQSALEAVAGIKQAFIHPGSVAQGSALP